MSAAGQATALDRFRESYWPLYAGDMAECEGMLARSSGQPEGVLGESCSSTLAAGGKRMRPLLVYLSARDRSEAGALHAAAAAVELVHMATLVHDDVLDGADLRRGRPTLVAQYGPGVSTAAGDFLFSSAFSLLAAAGSPRALSILARTSLDLSLGELLQSEQTSEFGLSHEAYFERCRLKTAGLFSAACRLGGFLSGCSPKTLDAVDEFGLHLGLAFQIADDILDFDADAETGKRAGADLRDGTVTLPLILAIEADASLMELLGGELSEEEIEQICVRVRASGALAIAREEAQARVARAREALGGANGELDVRPLELIAEMAADRKV